ncbi:DUF4148 domain-containing protein [Paraburkholderia acidipaludis]|uniref:DUF4148 domain-containing protein n=1 Tax=Paraburkholderia acidipaludis TaxID=660537 RepID=UPI0004814B1E|nr:DUF4148 domain-containing protein [Paraburkholderia acidipaludis]
MKTLIRFCLAASLAFATAAHAQTATQSTQPANTAPASTAANGAAMPAYGQPAHEKTRAEVYQELVRAEQDGQLKYLNSTLYAHH